ncbi:unnamed protein product [Sphagnum tenellum]
MVQNDLFRDTEVKGSLRLVNTLESPGILGSAEVLQGKLFFKDHVFQITNASAKFDNPNAFNPSFDLNANTEINGTKIQMFTTGRPDNIKIELTSTPPMSEQEIFTLLAVGLTTNDAKKLSASDLNIVQTGEAASLVLHSLDFNRDIEDKTGFQIVLDESVNPQQGVSSFKPQGQSDTAAAPRIKLRKQLSDRLSLSAGMHWLGKGPLAYGDDALIGQTQISSSTQRLPEVEIDRVEIYGVSLIKRESVLGAIELSAGDYLLRSKLLKSEENIQSLYQSHGYQEVRIESRLIREKSKKGKSYETVLEFKIREGDPVRIAKIQLVSNSSSNRGEDLDETLNGNANGSESGQKFWRAWTEKALRKINLVPGDLLDQDKIVAARTLMQELLASDSYVGSRVTDVTEELTSEPPAGAIPKPSLPASRWVNLEFHIDLGEHVAIGFQGNSTLSYVFLKGILDEQKVLGLGKDYIGTVQARIEDAYRSAGYALVKITPYTFEAPDQSTKRVTFYIDEGPRIEIDSVDFDGNSVFSSKELKAKFFSKSSSLIQNQVYVERDVQKAADALIEWLKENGYLSARLVTINTRYIRKTKSSKVPKSVGLVLYLYEGDQTEVKQFIAHGASAMNSEEIKKILGIKENAPLNLYALSDGLETLKKAYHENGYLDARILNEGKESLVTYSNENRTALVTLDLDEGRQYKVGRIEIEGLERTKEFVVTRVMDMNKGDILKPSKIVATERNLRRLGIFAKINIKTIDDPEASDQKNIRIILQEGDRGLLSGGPGFRNDLGIRAFGEFSYANIVGENQTASISLAVNRRGYQLNEINFQTAFKGTSLSFVNYRAQVDLPFSGALKIAVFIDTANLNIDTYSFGNLYYGAGFGLHYQTPVGPVPSLMVHILSFLKGIAELLVAIAYQVTREFTLAFGVDSPYSAIGNYSLTDSNPAYLDTLATNFSILDYDLGLAFRVSDHLSLGTTLYLSTASQGYSYTSGNPTVQSGSGSLSVVNFYVDLNILYKVDDNLSFGMSFKPARFYSFVSPYRNIMSPAKLTLGTAMAITPRLLAVLDIDFFGAPGDAVLPGSDVIPGFGSIALLNEVKILPHGGVEVEIVKEKNWDFIGRAGAYIESSRVLPETYRAHLTLGAEVRFWAFAPSAALDIANGYSNYTLGAAISLKPFKD